MSFEKAAWEFITDVKTLISGLGIFGAVILFVFREFLVGVMEKAGDWFATRVLRREKFERIKAKVETADKRGRLHVYLAEQLHLVNTRLDCCERLHRERDKKDESVAQKLLDCHQKREALAITHVKLVNEARASAIENAKLLAENSYLRGKLERV